MEREIDIDLELTKEDTLKQFEHSENKTQLTKRISMSLINPTSTELFLDPICTGEGANSPSYLKIDW